MTEEVKQKRTRRTPAQMAEFRAQQTKEKEVTEIYKCTDTNRMRLYLIKNDNKLSGCSLEELRFKDYNFQTQKFAGCKITNVMFEDCNFQGCNWTDVIDGTGNTFIRCELQYGTYPAGFFENNIMIDCKVK